MSGRPIKKATTDVSTVIRVVDSGDGTPETGVEHNTSGIDLWYRREGATKASITEAALTALDDAHSDGGIEHIGDGYYRLDLPDAACATGSPGVMVGGTVTGMVVIGTYHPLVDYDPYDSVRLGLTALPNAAADAAGGLPISDAGAQDIDTAISNIAAILADTGTDGVVVASGSKTGYSLTATTGLGNQTASITGNLSGSVGSVTGAVGSVTGAVGSVLGGLNTSAGTITTLDGLDTAQDSQHATTQSATTAIETDTQDIQSRIPAALTGAGNIKADALAINGSATAAARIERAGASEVLGTCDTGGTTTSIVASSLTPTSAVNDQFNGRIVIFAADTTTTALRGQATDITDYVHSTLTLTVTALTTAPSSGDTFSIV